MARAGAPCFVRRRTSEVRAAESLRTARGRSPAVRPSHSFSWVGAVDDWRERTDLLGHVAAAFSPTPDQAGTLTTMRDSRSHRRQTGGTIYEKGETGRSCRTPSTYSSTFSL